MAEASIEGIKIGDGSSVLEKLPLAVIVSERSGDTETKKYKAMGRSELSVTTQKGKVVYIEYDWLSDKKSTKTPFNGFVFGKTTLRDIRKRFGNNGFAYKQNLTADTDDNGLALFNCYELTDSTPTIFVAVSKITQKTGASTANIADRAKLDALILADPAYLDEIWGKEKIYDTAYKKISL
ncbi:MAG: hypothetical protein FWC42_10480 [Proteobacteria bacterium]|nr:hypothetical protein [Pseudomonadota bacterium]